MTTIRVECYAGYRGEEAPRRFYLGDQAVEVHFRPIADIALGYYDVGASDKEVKAWRLQT